MISFDRRFENVPFVASDNFHGGVLAANHLIDKGCKNLMFIGDDAQGETTTVLTEVSKRRYGFMEQCRMRGVEDVINIEYPLGDYIHIPKYVHENIATHPEVDGIFCISDAVATEVITHLEKAGRRVPEDVRVIGFDGGRSFNNLGKKLTSIGQDPERIAVALVDIIDAYYKRTNLNNQIIPIYFEQGDTA